MGTEVLTPWRSAFEDGYRHDMRMHVMELKYVEIYWTEKLYTVFIDGFIQPAVSLYVLLTLSMQIFPTVTLTLYAVALFWRKRRIWILRLLVTVVPELIVVWHINSMGIVMYVKVCTDVTVTGF